jgi:acetylornithine deacetylase/succinyl-diaminopimelate desuccinylase-like protein
MKPTNLTIDPQALSPAGKLRGALLFSALFCVSVATAADSTATPTTAAVVSPANAKAREIFAKLVGFETSIGKRQVPAMAQYLSEEFKQAGFPADDIKILPLKLPLEETASLVVRYRGDGSGGKPILLLAHMDVVTARREDWQRDPFVLVEENGFFYGRGTIDVKNGVTALTATFLRLKREGFVPKRDLIIYFSGDEETMQATTVDVARNHRDLIDAEYALNTDAGGGTLDAQTGKPLFYSLQTAEKTFADFELTTRNPGGHSSQPRADNAIYDLAAALSKLRGYSFPAMWNETTRASFKVAGETTPGALGEAMRRFAKNPDDTAAADTLAANPAYVGVTRTTCVATMLSGGHANNALPQSASAIVNCRIFPGVKVESVGQTLQQVVGAGVEVKALGNPMWSDASPLRADIVAAVTRAVRVRYPGLRVVPSQESGASDGLVFRSIGIPTYGVSDTFIKDKDQFAHGLNERLPVQSFYEGLEQWHRLLKDLAGSAKKR